MTKNRVYNVRVLIKRFPDSFPAAFNFPVLARDAIDARNRARYAASADAVSDWRIIGINPQHSIRSIA